MTQQCRNNTAGRVFARIEPDQKEQIVATMMQHGHFVAVTGDGVNDAPSMRRANVGIAMGKSGTDVARESSDLIITDDNFVSIVSGIEQGRVVYNNITQSHRLARRHRVFCDIAIFPERILRSADADDSGAITLAQSRCQWRTGYRAGIRAKRR